MEARCTVAMLRDRMLKDARRRQMADEEAERIGVAVRSQQELREQTRRHIRAARKSLNAAMALVR